MKNAYNLGFKNTVASHRLKDILNLADKVRNDPDKEQRIREKECVVCFYRTRMCGQAFTDYSCILCGARGLQWHNTCTPVLCEDCTTTHSLCRYCGADRELNLNRKDL